MTLFNYIVWNADPVMVHLPGWVVIGLGLLIGFFIILQTVPPLILKGKAEKQQVLSVIISIVVTIILAFLVSKIKPSLFESSGLSVRWYGLMFALGFLVSQQIMFYIFRKDGKPEKDVETLTIYMVIATIIGARLGHVLFYEPDKYLTNPIDIIKIWEGGLASHGATLGILVALYLYSKKKIESGQSYLWILDRIVIVVALTGALIRFGNFMNSEIIGERTNTKAGVVFARDTSAKLKYVRLDAIEKVKAYKEKSNDKFSKQGYAPLAFDIIFKKGNYTENDVKIFLNTRIKEVLSRDEDVKENIFEPIDTPLNYKLSKTKEGHFIAHVNTWGIPRYPAQLFEAISSFIIFIVLFLVWKKKESTMPAGRIFSIFLIVLFGLRFIYEFFKENQVEFEDNLTLNMGQWLSIPLILAGVILFIYTLKKQKDPKKQEQK